MKAPRWFNALVLTLLVLLIFGMLGITLYERGGLLTSPLTPLSLDDQVPRTRVGIHTIRPNESVAFIREAYDRGTRFAVVKAVDDFGSLHEVHAIDPEIVIVARRTHSEEGAGGVRFPETDLEAYAHVVMAPIFDVLSHDPALRDVVDYWEPINEPLGGGSPTEDYVRLAILMKHCIEIADANGLRLAIFSWNNGTPEHADYVGMIETGVFADAQAGGHALALHEGVWNDDPIDKWYPGGLPGGPIWPDAGALTMRYRNLYHMLESRGEVIPLIVSEWYSGGDYWNPVDVVSRLSWYDAQCLSDPYCLGFTPFTLGPCCQWYDEDYGGVYPAIIDYMVAQGSGPAPPTPTPEIPPELDEEAFFPLILK